MAGIKETQEALEAVISLSKVIVKLGADGYDLSDVVALGSLIVSDEKFRGQLVEGVQGVSKLAEELKDLEGAEVVQLLGAAYAELKKQA